MTLSLAQPHLFSELAPPPVAVRPIEARDYQTRSVEAARELVSAGENPLLMVLPTGGGKTTIAALLVNGSYAKARRALFVAHRREIIAQAFWRFVEGGIPERDCGVIMADGIIPHAITREAYSAQRPQARVQVASIQTLSRRRYPAADLVFIDEAHHSEASTYDALLKHYLQAGATIIGLTATAVRGDGKGLKKSFKHLHLCAHPSELIAGGHLVAPRVFVGRTKPDLSKVKVEKGDYVVEQLAEAVDTNVLVGQIVSEWQRLAEGRSTVVFATNVRHSLHITELFKAAGVAAEHIDANTDDDLRRAILKRLASGETTVVSNVGVLTEGFDCPRVKCIVLARPTQNLGLYIQMAGRGARPWEGVEGILLDHARCSERHGMPLEDRAWTLEDRPKGSGKGKDSEAPTKVCPECDEVSPLGTRACKCGFEWPAPELPEEVDGELVELTRTQAAAQGIERAKKDVNRRLAQIIEPYRAIGVDDGEAWTAANKAVWSVFRKSRPKMSVVELVAVLDSLSGGRAHEAVELSLAALPRPNPQRVRDLVAFEPDEVPEALGGWPEALADVLAAPAPILKPLRFLPPARTATPEPPPTPAEPVEVEAWSL